MKENVAQNDDEPDFSGKNRKNIGYKLFPVPDSRYWRILRYTTRVYGNKNSKKITSINEGL